MDRKFIELDRYNIYFSDATDNGDFSIGIINIKKLMEYLDQYLDGEIFGIDKIEYKGSVVIPLDVFEMLELD